MIFVPIKRSFPINRWNKTLAWNHSVPGDLSQLPGVPSITRSEPFVDLHLPLGFLWAHDYLAFCGFLLIMS